MTNALALLAYWSVRQKLIRVNTVVQTVQLRCYHERALIGLNLPFGRRPKERERQIPLTERRCMPSRG